MSETDIEEEETVSVQLVVYRVEKGCGNAIALIFDHSKAVIIDWGTCDTRPLEDLLKRGVKEVIGIVATHAHADHTLGLYQLIEFLDRAGIPIGFFVYPSGHMRASIHDYLAEARVLAKKLGMKMSALGIREFGENHKPILLVDYKGWDLSIISPPEENVANEEVAARRKNVNTGNETSLVLLLQPPNTSQQGNGRVLIPGDATPTTLDFAIDNAERYPQYDLHADVVVIPHHGSSHNWKEVYNPYMHSLAVICCGTSNLKLPAKSTLDHMRFHVESIGGQIICTSYSKACQVSFQKKARHDGNTHLTKPGACFGDVEINVKDQGSELSKHHPDATSKTEYGLCANCSEPL